jgi:hypothetical protein
VNPVNRERKLSAIAALSSRLNLCRPIAIRFLVLASIHDQKAISATIVRRFEHSFASTSPKTSQEQQQQQQT